MASPLPPVPGSNLPLGRFKACPRCGQTAELTASTCSGCGRVYRTRFNPPDVTTFFDAPAQATPSSQSFAPATTYVRHSQRRILEAVVGAGLGLALVGVVAFHLFRKPIITPELPPVTIRAAVFSGGDDYLQLLVFNQDPFPWKNVHLTLSAASSRDPFVYQGPSVELSPTVGDRGYLFPLTRFVRSDGTPLLRIQAAQGGAYSYGNQRQQRTNMTLRITADTTHGPGQSSLKFAIPIVAPQ